jgi:hypothetical protein
MVKLVLSTQSPLNSSYVNESGQVLYRVQTPLSVNTRVSTVHKIIPNTSNPPRVDNIELPIGDSDSQIDEKASESDFEDKEPEKELEPLSDAKLQDQFKLLGTLEHKIVGSSMWKEGDNSVELKSMFKKEGMGPFGQWVACSLVSNILC